MKNLNTTITEILANNPRIIEDVLIDHSLLNGIGLSEIGIYYEDPDSHSLPFRDVLDIVNDFEQKILNNMNETLNHFTTRSNESNCSYRGGFKLQSNNDTYHYHTLNHFNKVKENLFKGTDYIFDYMNNTASYGDVFLVRGYASSIEIIKLHVEKKTVKIGTIRLVNDSEISIEKDEINGYVLITENIKSEESEEMLINCDDIGSVHLLLLDNIDIPLSLSSAEKIAEKIIYTFIRHGTMIRKCKECGKYFCIPKRDQDRFQSKGLVLPKRCCFCRKYNKMKG